MNSRTVSYLISFGLGAAEAEGGAGANSYEVGLVQRLPVRVRVPKDVAAKNLLRAGMSVYVTVDTNEGAVDADSEADLDGAPMLHPK